MPNSTAELLRERQKISPGKWIFPNPLRPEQPVSPDAAYRRLKVLLERAHLPNYFPFPPRHHCLLHAAWEYIQLGTPNKLRVFQPPLNVYTHITDAMQRTAAEKIDRGIGGHETAPESENISAQASKPAFQPYKGKIRKPGTGCVTQLNEHLWEGRYSPKVNGKRMARNVYARTEAECEEKLAALIVEMKREIAVLRGQEQAG